MSAKIKNHLKPRSEAHHRHKPKSVSHREFAKTYWPYIPILLLVFFLFSFCVQSGALSAQVRHPGGKVLAFATHMSTKGLLYDSNIQRRDLGLDSLKLNSHLNAAAQSKADDMAARDYWSHNTPEGNPPWIFVTRQKYAYQKLGENLAAGFGDEQTTIDGWMASPPHRENLLDPAFTEVGFGFTNNPDYSAASGGPMTIVVAFYGRPEKDANVTAKTLNDTSGSILLQKLSKGGLSFNSPINTENTAIEAAHSIQTSRAQIALSKSHLNFLKPGLITIIAFAALGLWISRHLLVLRRVFVKGEAFAIKHPLLDLCLILIAILSWILTQSVGLVL